MTEEPTAIKESTLTFTMIGNIPVFGEPMPNAVAQMQNCAPATAHCALMADHHLGYALPVGGVAAYRGQVSPSGVGYDISCGNKAVMLDLRIEDVKSHIKTIMDEIWHTLSFGVGRVNDEPVEHALFEDDPAWDIDIARRLRNLAQAQLGTIGSGNHYVDLFADEEARVWVGVHFGSRGLGHRIATHFVKAGGGKDGINVAPALFDENSQLGQEYIACMSLAGRYAYAGRDWVCNKVAEILGAKIFAEVHNHHNFCVPGNATIPTTTGPKRMVDVRPGDTIYSWNETDGVVPTSVADQWCSGQEGIYTLSTDSRELNVSGDHPILTVGIHDEVHPNRPWHKKTCGQYTWKQTKEILVGDIIVCAEGYYNTNDRSIGIGVARLVGAFLGDGWVRHNPTNAASVGLAIGALGESHTLRYKNLLETVLPAANWSNNAPGAFGLTTTSRKVWDRMKELEVTGYANEKAVPEYAFSLPREEKLALLSGYFDADGSVASEAPKNVGRGVIATTNVRLAHGLRELAISCGLAITTISQSVITTNFKADVKVYRCSLRAHSMAELDLWHQTKCQRISPRSKNSYGLPPEKLGYLDLAPGTIAQRVRSVSMSDAETVYDLEVASDSHAFICEGVVVHNCWREEHYGESFWVIRKGATPAWPGQRGFIGGSMGDNAMIVEGVDSDESIVALRSTVHGAGRVISRTQAAGKSKWVRGKPTRVTEGAVSRQMMHEWVDGMGVELRGAGTDEAPQVYKRLPEVLQYYSPTIKILHTLTPIGVAMAGEDEVDPYKD